MKNRILLTLTMLPVLGWAQTTNFSLKAKLSNEKAGAKAYLMYGLDGKMFTDSAVVSHGAFEFKGMLKDPSQAQLILDHSGLGLTKLGEHPDALILYVEKGNINLTAADSIKNAVITGSKLNEDNKKYQALTSADDKSIIAINDEYAAAPQAKQNDPEFVKDIKARYAKLVEDERILQFGFVKQNPNSYLSVMLLIQLAGETIDVPMIEPSYKNLSAEVRNTFAGQSFAKSIAAAKATVIGSQAPVFMENDKDDKPVKLSDFLGKYVLLDFWASWCGPCRAENPNVVKAYQTYKAKNFTVLGVSLDQPGQRDKWLAAIKADGLEWTQVSDLKGWENEAARKYGIRSIPQNYLIDPSGKIIATNLRGEALNEKLKSLFN